jgi:hypothetical protein
MGTAVTELAVPPTVVETSPVLVTSPSAGLDDGGRTGYVTAQ